MSSIAILTATRAEYGLLKPFIRALQEEGIETRVLVTGTHLSSFFGNTVNEIEADGIEIDERIPILVDSDSPTGISKTMALALSGFADYFARRRPDALLVLGDRYETLAVCSAAFNERIPIFHLYGGETTEGAVDEAIRHAVTKMSYLHFTSTDAYRKRVIQLGEAPERVFNIGAIGIENAMRMSLLDRQELTGSLGINADIPYAVMTYHPVTLDSESPLEKLEELLEAMSGFPNLLFIATKANADACGRAINMRLAEFEAENANFLLFDSLGSLRYLSALKHAEVVIGNSSSGLLEAPAFGVPTVNIGNRQNGRIRPSSVIDCDEDRESIEQAIALALGDDFRDVVQKIDNPYYKQGTSLHAAQIMAKTLDGQINLQKRFYDIDFTWTTA